MFLRLLGLILPDRIAWINANSMSISVWVTHICVSYLTSIGSDNGLSPGRRQAIIWTNAGILLIRSLVRKLSEISIEITFSLKKMHLKMSSGKWRPFRLNVLNHLHHIQRNVNQNTRHYFQLNAFHDDVIKWKHFLRYWPFVRGFRRSPVTRSFGVFFDLHLIKRLSKHSRGWWLETLSHPLWRHCNMKTSAKQWSFCSRLNVSAHLHNLHLRPM